MSDDFGYVEAQEALGKASMLLAATARAVEDRRGDPNSAKALWTARSGLASVMELLDVADAVIIRILFLALPSERRAFARRLLLPEQEARLEAILAPLDNEGINWPDGYVPVERIIAMVRLLGPEEMTPTAKRQFEKMCDEYLS